MDAGRYWAEVRRRSLSRRRLLAAGGTGAAVLALSGCSTKSTNRPSAAGAGSRRGMNRRNTEAGGTLNTYVQFNAPLDPQKVSAAPQVLVSGVYSRSL